MKIGYFLSCEEYTPAQLVEQAVLAERAGFDALWISDHFHPWNDEQGQSPFVWSVIGALSEVVDLPITTAVTCPTIRIHPAVIAQAAATAAVQLDGRFVLGLGSGEALNEHVTGDPWPTKDVRMARLRECVDVMRALWRGEEVSHRGLVTVDRARVWSLPDEPPKLVAGAVSAETAAWAADWADGLITVNQPLDLLRRVVGSYRDAGGRGELHLQVHLS